METPPLKFIVEAALLAAGGPLKVEQMIELFRIEDVNTSAARFDPEKLAWMNQQYLKSDDPAAVAVHFDWHLRAVGIDPASGPNPADVVVALRDRVKTLKEMAERAKVWYGPITEWDDKAVAKQLVEAARAPLMATRAALEALSEWTPEAIDGALRAVGEQLEIGMGKVAQPLRVAMTGTAVSPSIDHTVYLCGQAEALKRIDAALERIAD